MFKYSYCKFQLCGTIVGTILIVVYNGFLKVSKTFSFLINRFIFKCALCQFFAP